MASIGELYRSDVGDWFRVVAVDSDSVCVVQLNGAFTGSRYNWNLTQLMMMRRNEQ